MVGIVPGKVNKLSVGLQFGVPIPLVGYFIGLCYFHLLQSGDIINSARNPIGTDSANVNTEIQHESLTKLLCCNLKNCSYSVSSHFLRGTKF